MLGLAVDAVDFLRRTVHVRQQIKLVGGELVFSPPKGGREREVPLPDLVSVALAEQLRRSPAVDVTLPWVRARRKPCTSPQFFVNRDGGPLTRATSRTTSGSRRSRRRVSSGTGRTACMRCGITSP
ncbi:MAG: hypothetical protein H0V12_01280, partial [Chloroflexi bacterium]|nr:hypothetical protein [Chloroflexota bacterium]